MEKALITNSEITQTQFLKNKINVLLDSGETNKKKIYSKILEETKIPRSTIRRTARQLRFEYLKKLKVLCDDDEVNPLISDSYSFVPKHLRYHFENFVKENFIEIRCMICKNVTGFCQQKSQEPIICSICRNMFPEKIIVEK